MIFKILQILGFAGGGLMVALITNVLLLHFARTLGIRNKNDVIVRWSSESKPSLGGISFFMVFIFASIGYSIMFDEVNIFQNKKYVGLFLSGSLAFVMGLADDAYDTRPWIKLVTQILCGVILALTGTHTDVFHEIYIDGPLTVLWVVVIMNSLNMLDNMDGITGTTVFFILVSCLVSGWILFDFNTNIWTLLMASGIGAIIGFLVMNVHPSKLFMGDAGSQFIGLFVAYFGIDFMINSSSYMQQPSWLGICATIVAFTPAAVDTLTVVINRLKRGQSPMVGGKDHTTHHLAYSGLSDRKVWYVFVIIGFFATLLSIGMVHLMKLEMQVTVLLFVLYFAFVFALLFRNTIKYKGPSNSSS